MNLHNETINPQDKLLALLQRASDNKGDLESFIAETNRIGWLARRKELLSDPANMAWRGANLIISAFNAALSSPKKRDINTICNNDKIMNMSAKIPDLSEAIETADDRITWLFNREKHLTPDGRAIRGTRLMRMGLEKLIAKDPARARALFETLQDRICRAAR